MGINFLLRDLKLNAVSALSCALVLPAFNAGQAMEQSMTINTNNSYNYTSANDHLVLAKQEFSNLEQIINEATKTKKVPEDSHRLLKARNSAFSEVQSTMQNLINCAPRNISNFTTIDILDQAMKYGLEDLQWLDWELTREAVKLKEDHVYAERKPDMDLNMI